MRQQWTYSYRTEISLESGIPEGLLELWFDIQLLLGAEPTVILVEEPMSDQSWAGILLRRQNQVDRGDCRVKGTVTRTSGQRMGIGPTSLLPCVKSSVSQERR